jgi:phosphate transport system protein
VRHYEQRLTEDLEEIRTAVKEIADAVASGLERAVRAIQTGDRDMLHDVALDDVAVNRRVREIDGLCHAFVARHLPAAGHLRFISAVLRLMVALERAGDYAATVSRVVLQLETRLSPDIVNKIVELAELSHSMFGDAIRAFLDGDVELCAQAREQGRRIDAIYDSIFQALVSEEPRRPPFELASLLSIFSKIERFSDQAKNICDQTAFAATGQARGSKVFRVLFLDEKNDFLSPLAAAIARRSFPEGGVYSSAGWAPVAERHPHLARVAERFSLEIPSARPRKVRELGDFPVHYHVVAAINASPDNDVPHIPYHTILRRWNDIPVPTATEGPELDEQLDALVRVLSARIRTLMERLRGKAAD